VLHVGLHLRQFRKRLGFGVPHGTFWTGAVVLGQHLLDRLDAVGAKSRLTCEALLDETLDSRARRAELTSATTRWVLISIWPTIVLDQLSCT
jgi:hypothetical protein